MIVIYRSGLILRMLLPASLAMCRPATRHAARPSALTPQLPPHHCCHFHPLTAVIIAFFFGTVLNGQGEDTYTYSGILNITGVQ